MSVKGSYMNVLVGDYVSRYKNPPRFATWLFCVLATDFLYQVFARLHTSLVAEVMLYRRTSVLRGTVCM